MQSACAEIAKTCFTIGVYIRASSSKLLGPVKGSRSSPIRSRLLRLNLEPPGVSKHDFQKQLRHSRLLVLSQVSLLISAMLKVAAIIGTPSILTVTMQMWIYTASHQSASSSVNMDMSGSKITSSKAYVS